MQTKNIPLAAVVAAITWIGTGLGFAQAFPPAGIKNQDVGVPSLAGSYTVAGGKITIVGGGNDIWGSSDNFHYAYVGVTGDFDYVVKVDDLQGPDNWSKAELMAREGTDDGAGGFSFDGGDRHISNMTTRAGGQNEVALQWRSDASGSGSAWPNDIGIGTPVRRPTYPNTWLRLERVGSRFWGYASADGSAWTELRGGGYDFLSLNGNEAAVRTGGNMANKLALGLAVTAHNDGDLTGAVAVFSAFKPFTPLPITITAQPPATRAVPANSPLTLSAAGTGDPVHFQWRKDGVDIPGATSATYTKAVSQTTDAGSYTVRLFGAGQTAVISAASVVTVTADNAPPTIARVGGGSNFKSATITFSEAMNDAAITPSNYQFSGGLTVSAAEFVVVNSADPANVANRTSVKLTTSTQTTGAGYDLTVNANVKDVANNSVSPNTGRLVAQTVKTGLLVNKRWLDLGHRNFETLLSEPAVYENPTTTLIRSSAEENDTDIANAVFPTTLEGFFIPATTGDYVFFMTTDNDGWLYLSTDEDPAHQVLIAADIGWQNARVWTGAGGDTAKRRGVGDGTGPFENRSDELLTSPRGLAANWGANRPFPEVQTWPTMDANGNAKITLTAGKRYSFTLYRSEGESGQGGVTFKLASEADPANGTATRMTGNLIAAVVDPTLLGPVITANPTNVDFTVGATLLFSVAVDSALPATYQWRFNGSNIAGETNSTLTIANAGVSAVGSYSVVVANKNGSVTSDPAALAYTPVPAPGLTFQQDNTGLLVVEAENYFSSTRSADGHVWVLQSTRSGLSGSGYMQALADSGANRGDAAAAIANSPRLDFKVIFSKTGTHYIWLRGGDPSGNGAGDSIHGGIDGAIPANGVRIDGAPGFNIGSGWNWVGAIQGNTRAFFEVATAGEHTVSVWMREDGFNLDKVLLTTDEAFTPTGTGPAESARVGGSAATISVARDATGAPVITFTGTLTSSATVNGAFTDVANAKSPYTAPTTAAQQFFKSK